MMILITGGSKCGKSSVAEGLLNGFPGEKYYIAAMEPYGEDAQRAIARHREMRRGKGFRTIDRPRDIRGILLPDGAKTLHAASERTPSGWDVTYELPFQLLRLFFPDFAPSGTIRGNFYKCGDLTVQEHYLAWNRVDAERPDFHLPKYFGALIFSE